MWLEQLFSLDPAVMWKMINIGFIVPCGHKCTNHLYANRLCEKKHTLCLALYLHQCFPAVLVEANCPARFRASPASTHTHCSSVRSGVMEPRKTLCARDCASQTKTRNTDLYALFFLSAPHTILVHFLVCNYRLWPICFPASFIIQFIYYSILTPLGTTGELVDHWPWRNGGKLSVCVL